MDLDEDLDCLDGWDELPEWARTKIKDALVNGHVDDEDWKGVSCNLFASLTASITDILRNPN